MTDVLYVSVATMYHLKGSFARTDMSILIYFTISYFCVSNPGNIKVMLVYSFLEWPLPVFTSKLFIWSH